MNAPSLRHRSSTPILRGCATIVSCSLLLVFVGAAALAQELPTTTTGAATGLSSTGATLNGTVNANGAITTVTFEYGQTAAYGATWPADQSPVSGSTNTAVKAGVTGLLPSTTYHYRVVAVNANGTAYGADMTFTTLSGPAISLNHIALNYGAVQGGVSTGPQDFLINNSGGGTLDWTVSESQTWIGTSPSSGVGSGTVTVTVEPSGLTAGTYTGVVTVSDPNASNSPQTVTVSLTVYNVGATSAPIGAFRPPSTGRRSEARFRLQGGRWMTSA